MTMYTSMVLMGGWGRRSPFSSRSGMSLVEIPSYGFPPKVISSQMVTPKKISVEKKKKNNVNTRDPNTEKEQLKDEKDKSEV